MVPEGWKIKSVGDLCVFVNGNGFKSSEWSDSGLPIIRIQNLNGSKDFNYYNGKIKNQWVVNPGDILFAWAGTKGVSFGIKWWKGPKGVLNQHIFRVEPVFGVNYLWFYMVMLSVTARVEAKAHGFKSTLVHVQKNDIINQMIYVPPYEEQQKIAEILSAWDKAIATTEQLLANSQQQKKALMQQLLTGKKRLLDENGKRFEGEWASLSIGDAEECGWVKLGRGKVISKKDIIETPGEFPIYSSSVRNSGLMGQYGKYMFDEELISWSVDGGGDFFYRPKHKFSITNVSGYMKVDQSKVDYKFLAYQLEMLHAHLKFNYQTKAHPSIVRAVYVVCLPSPKEQNSISRIISTCDHEVDWLQQKINSLKQEKKALMQQLLTGKRRVKTT